MTSSMTSLLRAPGAALVALAGALAGCQSLQSSDSFLGVITPYRIEVVQGNVITSEQVGAAQAGPDARPGARRARLAAADRPVPRRPLGLRLHDPPPGRRAAAAPRRRPLQGRRARRASKAAASCRASASSSPRSTPSRPRATRRRWSSPRSRSRPCRRRCGRRAPEPVPPVAGAHLSRRSSRAHDGRARAPASVGASPSPAPPAAWAGR